jgi:phage terminase small subunit
MGNHNSGRRPSPARLTLLRGNPGKRAVNRREPIPPAGVVTMPPGLTPDAVGIWTELAPVCLEMGTLTLADRRAFATLCELQATLQLASRWKANRRRRAEGIALEQKMAATIRPYYALFGLEPVSRARIAVPRPEAAAAVSKWAEVLP